jgi:hypothetical protein
MPNINKPLYHFGAAPDLPTKQSASPILKEGVSGALFA